MKLFKNNKKNDKITKSKEIIKKEKLKIKEERKKQRKENFNKSLSGRIINKIFKKKQEDTEVLSLKEQIFSMLYFEIIGVILCLVLLFALSGGRNYIKLYTDLKKLINVYDTITSNYYGDINKDELIDSAINSMVTSIGDNYTTYTNSKTKNEALEELEGTYEGIGCMVSMTQTGQIIVVNIFENSPAKNAGLEPNDIIIKIDDEDFSKKTSEEMAEYVKNSKKEKIKLTIKRKDEEKVLTIKRKKVEIPSVSSQVIEKDNKKIGYIDISIFSGVTYNQFKNNLEKIEKEGIEGLVIDVRSDPGGYLSAVTDISKLFLKKGSTIYQLEDDKNKEKVLDDTKEHRQYPIAILINGTSASASEILASAIKESYNGIVIGTNSYGKGTVQKTRTLEDGSIIKYTAQKWLTPKGNWINEKGVEPTIKVEPDIEKISKGIDNQLETALTEIMNKLKED